MKVWRVNALLKLGAMVFFVDGAIERFMLWLDKGGGGGGGKLCEFVAGALQ